MNFKEQLEKTYQDTPTLKLSRERIEFYLSVKKLNGYEDSFVIKNLKNDHDRKQITLTDEDLLYLAFRLNYQFSWVEQKTREWKIMRNGTLKIFNYTEIWLEILQKIESSLLANFLSEEGKLLYVDHILAIIGLKNAALWELAYSERKKIKEALRKSVHQSMQIQLVITPDLELTLNNSLFNGEQPHQFKLLGRPDISGMDDEELEF